MNSISRIDLLIAQLQTQLRRQIGRSSPQDGAAAGASKMHLPSSPIGAVGTSALERMFAVREAGMSDERQLARYLLEGLLVDEFGSQTANDAGFQQTVTMVLETLQDDPESWALCTDLIRGRAV